jgi:hypothetical protein
MRRWDTRAKVAAEQVNHAIKAANQLNRVETGFTSGPSPSVFYSLQFHPGCIGMECESRDVLHAPFFNHPRYSPWAENALSYNGIANAHALAYSWNYTGPDLETAPFRTRRAEHDFYLATGADFLLSPSEGAGAFGWGAVTGAGMLSNDASIPYYNAGYEGTDPPPAEVNPAAIAWFPGPMCCKESEGDNCFGKFPFGTNDHGWVFDREDGNGLLLSHNFDFSGGGNVIGNMAALDSFYGVGEHTNVGAPMGSRNSVISGGGYGVQAPPELKAMPDGTTVLSAVMFMKANALVRHNVSWSSTWDGTGPPSHLGTLIYTQTTEDISYVLMGRRLYGGGTPWYDWDSIATTGLTSGSSNCLWKLCSLTGTPFTIRTRFIPQFYRPLSMEIRAGRCSLSAAPLTARTGQTQMRMRQNCSCTTAATSTTSPTAAARALRGTLWKLEKCGLSSSFPTV